MLTGCPQEVATPDLDTSALDSEHADHAAAGSGGFDTANDSAAHHVAHSPSNAANPAVPPAHTAHEAPKSDGASSAADAGTSHEQHPAPAAPAADGGAPAADPHAGHTPAAQAAPTAPAAPSGSTTSPSTHAGHTPAPGSVGGPYIDLSAIPEGDPGSSTLDLGTTNEKPAPSDGTGAFRTRCSYSHMLFDDPIVFPGKAGAAHLHTFFGNTAADANSTAESLRNSGNSTCRGGIMNRSSYWVPTLIDAQGKPVEPNDIDVYYKSGYNGIEPEQVQPFPQGLRMIAGSAKASGPQTHAYWACHANYIGHPSTIPQCKKGDQLVMVVEFPQCWDGKNLDSADHMSHMSYTKSGKCPSTHPVPIPAITFNVLYPVRDVQGWRLSSDMYDTSLPGGYSVHGDWFEGWDQDLAKAFVKNCVNKAVDCHSHLVGDGRTIE